MFLMSADENFKDKMPPIIYIGRGRTTCAYFLPDNKHLIYASTHLVANNCPDVPLRKKGKSIRLVYDSFDIFMADLEGIS